jgi:DNA primase
MKAENLSFVEALTRLADRVGVPISQARNEAQHREENQRLFAANEAAAVYFHQLLLNSKPVLRYATERGIAEGTIQRFLIGLAPDSSDAVQRALGQQGFTRDEMEAAGLLYISDEGAVRDRYRGRLMFPIRDSDGRIVSFGGRTLNPEINPKYLNGPQTGIFDKGGTLYGLDAATAAIKKERRAVIVEGYVDVVIAHQAGFQNVVATLGTSITDRHLRQLSRLSASDICLALDPDTAGQTAALRGAEVAREALADSATPVPLASGAVSFATTSRSAVRVVELPDGLDPDELILADPARWQEAVASARPVIDYLLDRLAQRFDLGTAQGKVDAVDAVTPLLLEIPDPIQRAHYVELAAERIRTDPAALGAKLRAQVEASRRRVRAQATRALSSSPPPSAPPARAPVLPGREQEWAIALTVIAARRGVQRPVFEPGDFADPSARALLYRVLEVAEASGRADWRPDLLEVVEDPWLADACERVRTVLHEVDRLTDPQLAASATAIARQLRDHRLATELEHLRAIAQDPEGEMAGEVRARIAQLNQERVALHRDAADQPRGPGALGQRQIVPSRFRVMPLDH